MSDWNSLTIVGNVGRDPELKHTDKGVPVCSFSVAVNDNYRDDTQWFECTAWRSLAETVAQHVQKGSRVLIRGGVRGRAYARKDGTPGMSLDLDASDVVFLGKTAQDQQAALEKDYADVPF